MYYENQICLHCDKELEVKEAEGIVLGICYCENCDKTYELEWDIVWEESGEEYHYFWLTEIKHQVKKDGKIINLKTGKL